MSLPQLSLSAARHLHLAAQGLLKKPRRRAQPADILSTVQRMSLLQIDTINIVARSPYLVLFSRLGNYPPQWLDDALSKGDLMEYWAHEEWMQEHATEIVQLIEHIQQNGPVRSADFEHPRKGTSGWWEWKPHKRHLEGLFTSGKVMVIERRNFQRVYDLTHRVMPHWDDERDLLTQEAAEAIMLENSARSLGIFRPQWLADYYRLRQPALKPLLEMWQREHRVIPVTVETLGDMWLHSDLLLLLPQALESKLQATHSAVLSPFDPVVWDRKRAEQLFNFSYRLECYTPAPKRQYGYFVLPLLHKGQLVGRMDAKMHRKTGTLEIIALYLEEGIKTTAALEKGLTSAISEFACWQGAHDVALGRVPDGLFSTCRRGWETDTP